MQIPSSQGFCSIREWDNEFLALFPHRYDYIWAEHPALGARPQWQTESRHPLSDRLIKQSSYLYGVRFGAQTKYCLFDIDISSIYHPKSDPFAVSRIVAALEPIGLVSYLTCTSSYSGGIHLYLPFTSDLQSWELAHTLQALLENAGFRLAKGELELFPNPKLYSADCTPTLYAAHRLPMQGGSYILDSDWNLTNSDQYSFVQQWQLVQNKNDINTEQLSQVLKQVKRQRYRISGKAEKFLNDLNAEIEPGWSGRGQTNHLLGRITLRCYVFAHILYASAPLAGKALVDEIVKIACSLPGYEDWCQHQHEIEQRAEEWARCVENSHYFPYGSEKGKYKQLEDCIEKSTELPTRFTWNQQQSLKVRDKIAAAIGDLLNQERLPAGATARFRVLTTNYSISGSSLYRHRDLWHPNHLEESPPAPPSSKNNLSCDSADGASHDKTATSLLCEIGCNPLPNKDSSDLVSSSLELMECNASLGRDSSDRNDEMKRVSSANEDLKGPRFVQQLLFEIKGRLEEERKERKEALLTRDKTDKRSKTKEGQALTIKRMQGFLKSGDGILVNEAIAWARDNPGLIDISKIGEK